MDVKQASDTTLLALFHDNVELLARMKNPTTEEYEMLNLYVEAIKEEILERMMKP